MLSERFPILCDINMLTIFLRLLLCIICGSIVGLERIKKSKSMGLRTHVLVCMGATMVMMTNQYILQVFDISDPSRMGAQVVSGIGFLGAGAIMVTGRRKVKGLTTAAGLWASAGIGLAVGIGFYEAAVICAVLIVAVEILLGKLSNTILSNSNVFDFYVEFNEIGHMSKFISKIRANGLSITEMEMTDVNTATGASVAAIVTIHSPQAIESPAMLEIIGDMKGIKFVERI